ncbi:hypothetical protein SAMN05878276_0848 [Aquipseudomonas alcaligenes]|uniref:hypothetical protein n=1 Tax=Aquipseudomonas alcaligenes TaxID=43263 RepID=UPI0009542051|nr:hypothetical protein [Pseudomonas alcaligenes]SIR91634.1 hypothetical protein SAMN05878276_0848 [Pseudomonas alcaligenes]
METRFYILLSRLEPDVVQQLVINLSAQKAVFVDEVEPKWRELYLALEYLDLPDEVVNPNGGVLACGWDVDFDLDQLQVLVDPFVAAGLVPIAAALVLEDGSSFLVRPQEKGMRVDDTTLIPQAETFLGISGFVSGMLGTGLGLGN